MAGSSSMFFSPYRKFLKAFNGLNKKIHEATGKIEPGGNVEKRTGVNQMAGDFRQVGRIPEDKSGFPTQHLGDNK